MTPAIKLAKKNKVIHTVHEYSHDASAVSSGESYGQEAASKMGVAPEKVFKTLVVMLETKELVVAIIPVSSMLSMKHIAKAAKAKKAVMANKQDVERSTGYVLGGVSPLGQKKRLRSFIDASAEGFTSVFVSAGKRGLEIELNPVDLAQLLSAHFIELSAE
jgi:Cys-tRNA(Pro)/Cys-tRNA(Cys) deacylase